jgi:hypothetical protein
MKFHVTWKKRDLNIPDLSFYDKMVDNNVRLKGVIGQNARISPAGRRDATSLSSEQCILPCCITSRQRHECRAVFNSESCKHEKTLNFHSA